MILQEKISRALGCIGTVLILLGECRTGFAAESLSLEGNVSSDTAYETVALLPVTVLTMAGKTVATTKCDAFGRYRFRDVPLGLYQVSFGSPVGFGITVSPVSVPKRTPLDVLLPSRGRLGDGPTFREYSGNISYKGQSIDSAEICFVGMARWPISGSPDWLFQTCVPSGPSGEYVLRLPPGTFTVTVKVKDQLRLETKIANERGDDAQRRDFAIGPPRK